MFSFPGHPAALRRSPYSSACHHRMLVRLQRASQDKLASRSLRLPAREAESFGHCPFFHFPWRDNRLATTANVMHTPDECTLRLAATSPLGGVEEGDGMRRDLVLTLIVPILSVAIAVAIIVAIGETLLFARAMTHDRWPPVFVGTVIMIAFTLLAWLLSRRPSTAR